MSREVLQCALDLTVLRTLAAIGPQHGLGLANRILQVSEGLLDLNQGMLYPALLRLEQRRWVTSRWGLSDHNRKAKFYELTTRGRREIRVGYDGSLERVAALPRSATVMLAATLLSHVSEDLTHVRALEPRILALIETGIRRSETFRHLVDTLNASDVIVYIEPKQTREALGGYLSHKVTAGGAFRYLRVKIVTQGAENRLISVLAHELQHAVEVAQAPEARDAESLANVVRRLAFQFGCDSTTCYETQASRDVEHAVRDELRAAARQSRQ
jgi:DNA-binding PadR family transcriptional regulator